MRRSQRARRPQRGVARPQHPHRGRGVAQHAAAIGNAAEEPARTDRQPGGRWRARRATSGAHSGVAQGRRGARRAAPPSRFGDQHDHDGGGGEHAPAPGDAARTRPSGSTRQLQREPSRPRDLVVRLAHALRPEVTGRRRAPRHEDVVEHAPRGRRPRRSCAPARDSRTSRGRRSRRWRSARNAARPSVPGQSPPVTRFSSTRPVSQHACHGSGSK